MTRTSNLVLNLLAVVFIGCVLLPLGVLAFNDLDKEPGRVSDGPQVTNTAAFVEKSPEARSLVMSGEPRLLRDDGRSAKTLVEFTDGTLWSCYLRQTRSQDAWEVSQCFTTPVEQVAKEQRAPWVRAGWIVYGIVAVLVGLGTALAFGLRELKASAKFWTEDDTLTFNLFDYAKITFAQMLFWPVWLLLWPFTGFRWDRVFRVTSQARHMGQFGT